jgi:hypothetical protein
MPLYTCLSPFFFFLRLVLSSFSVPSLSDLEVFFFILRWIGKRQCFSLRRCNNWMGERLAGTGIMDPSGTARIVRHGWNHPEWRPVRVGVSSMPFWCLVRDVSAIPAGTGTSNPKSIDIYTLIIHLKHRSIRSINTPTI